MGEITTVLLKLSNKLTGFMMLSASCLIVGAAFLWQQHINDRQFEQQQQLYQQQTAALLTEVIESQLTVLKDKMHIATDFSHVRSALADTTQPWEDYAKATHIASAISYTTDLFPEVEKVCLFDIGVDDIDNNACIPITFSVLSSLRQAKQQEGAVIGVINVATDNAYLLVTQRVTDSDEQVIGVLAVALPFEIVVAELFNIKDFKGYAELQQGTKSQVTLTTIGDPRWKIDKASQLNITDSHWRILYWTENGVKPVIPSMTIVIVIVLITLIWLLQKLIEAYRINKDLRLLKQQLTDVKTGTLKPQYHVTAPLFQELADEIKDAVLSITSANTVAEQDEKNTQSTSARLMERREERYSVEQAVADELSDEQPHVTVDSSIFKAYDIRDIVGETVTEDIVNIIGQALGSEVLDRGLTELVVGRDGRNSSPALAQALINGILTSGCNVINLAMVTTPALYFAAEQAYSKSGVMVTGSHNPNNYNGLKVVIAGKALAEDELKHIHQRLTDNKLHRGQGSCQDMDISEQYISRISADITLARVIKVVIDCGNGVAGLLAPKLFKTLGCEVIELYCDVDGDFPNHHPDPSQADNLTSLINEVANHEAELGLAFDGDGDRLGVVDSSGNIISPDRLMILFARDLLAKAPGSVIMYDVKSTNLLEEEITRAGGEAVMGKSGHSIIRNEIQQIDAELAGEMSGHIFFNDRWFGFDDALYAASRLLELVSHDRLKQTATAIFAALPNRVSTPEIMVEMSDIESREFIEQMVKEADFAEAKLTTIDGIRADYPYGWGLVRASNTMPGLSLRFEADTLEQLQQIQQDFKREMLTIKPTLLLSFLTLDKK